MILLFFNRFTCLLCGHECSSTIFSALSTTHEEQYFTT